MGKKGKKSAAGQPENPWGEIKSERFETRLTPTGKRLLFQLAESLNLTPPEIIEQVARGVFQSDHRLVDFLERCATGRPVSDLEIVKLGHDLEIDVQVLVDIRDCLSEKWRAKHAIERD